MNIPEAAIAAAAAELVAYGEFSTLGDRQNYANAYTAARAALQAAAPFLIEECAKVCEQQANGFLSPQYATPQPMGSFSERFACDECAKAIRALTQESKENNAK